MKIIILNNLYKPFARGGAERVIERLVGELNAQGHQTLVVTSLPLGRKASEDNSAHYLRGLPSLFYWLGRLPKPLRLLLHFFGYADPFVYWQIKKQIRRFEPDLIITNNLVGLGLSCVCAIKGSGVKHVHILHDIQLLHPSGLLLWGKEDVIQSWPAKRYQALNNTYFNKANLIISPSQWLLDLHLNQGMFNRASTMAMSNPAVTEHATAQAKPSDFIDCLSVGQLEPHKGTNILLEAFARLPDNYRLRIIGNGTQEDAVKEISERDSRVTLFGRQTPEQVAVEMSRSSLLIVPSLCYENSPTIIYEAMGCALPVIASNLGGIPELIVDQANLFMPGDAQSLINTILGPYNRSQKLPSSKIITLEAYVHTLLDKIKALD